MLHALKHNKALHERVVMMQVDTEDVPRVLDDRRLEIAEIGKGFYTMRVRYGFMDEPNIMRALALCRVQHFISAARNCGRAAPASCDGATGCSCS